MDDSKCNGRKRERVRERERERGGGGKKTSPTGGKYSVSYGGKRELWEEERRW